jgi:hypothetical protein
LRLTSTTPCQAMTAEHPSASNWGLGW